MYRSVSSVGIAGKFKVRSPELARIDPSVDNSRYAFLCPLKNS